MRFRLNADIGFEGERPAMTAPPERKLMGWMAPAPIGVAMRHTADVHICLSEEPPNASYHNRP